MMDKGIKLENICKSKTEEEKIHSINKIIARLICKLGSTEYYKITMKQQNVRI